jgi:hypothetical protein
MCSIPRLLQGRTPERRRLTASASRAAPVWGTRDGLVAGTRLVQRGRGFPSLRGKRASRWRSLCVRRRWGVERNGDEGIAPVDRTAAGSGTSETSTIAIVRISAVLAIRAASARWR